MNLYDNIEKVGGLATTGELAKRWGVHRTRVDALSRMPGFPTPILSLNGGTKLFPVKAADRWRNERLALNVKYARGDVAA